MVKLFVMDVDGTLTDGKIYMGDLGESFKAFDIKDGCGIHDLLRASAIEPVIITGRTSHILEKRAKELGINYVYQGVVDKLAQLKQVLIDNNLELSDVAYIGDDINDISCMQSVTEGGGISACPLDAVDEVKKIVNYVCKKNGGNGAVRDFINWILKQKEEYNYTCRIEEALRYVKSQNIDNLLIGKYDMPDGSYFFVKEYTTQKEENCRVESHRRYIEVQWILRGREKIRIADIDKLIPEDEYDNINDIVYWKPINNMTEVVLSNGGYVVLYPSNAHMSCISIDNQEIVRKIEIRILI